MKTSLSIFSVAFASVLLLGGCVSNEATRRDPAPSSPAGHVWTLASIQGEGVVLPDGAQVPDLRFAPDGLSVSGFTGVNGFSGRAEFDGNDLRFGPLATTRRSGPVELMQIEGRYTAALTNVSAWRIEHRQLVLLAGDVPVLVFELQPPRVQL